MSKSYKNSLSNSFYAILYLCAFLRRCFAPLLILVFSFLSTGCGTSSLLGDIRSVDKELSVHSISSIVIEKEEEQNNSDNNLEVLEKHSLQPLTPEERQAISIVPWWHYFHSSFINQMIEKAFDSDRDLLAVAWDLHAAELRLNAQFADRLPMTSLNLGASSSWSFGKYSSPNTPSFSSGLSVGYEIDIWNKIGALHAQEEWNAQATIFDLRGIQLSLSGKVVESILKIAYLNDRVSLLEKNLSVQQRDVEQSRIKYEAGAISNFDYLSTENSLLSIKSEILSVQGDLELTKLQLALYTGDLERSYVSSSEEKGSLQKEFSLKLNRLSLDSFSEEREIPSLPLKLLAKRPDVFAAKIRLQAELAGIAATERDYWPTISLSGGISSSGVSLSSFIEQPIASIAASLAIPFVKFYTNKVKLEQQEALLRRSIAKFEQVVLRAVMEVRTALYNLKQNEEEKVILVKRRTLQENLLKIEKLRYEEGAKSIDYYMNAQKTMRSIDLDLITNRYQRARLIVSLALALGNLPL